MRDKPSLIDFSAPTQFNLIFQCKLSTIFTLKFSKLLCESINQYCQSKSIDVSVRDGSSTKRKIVCTIWHHIQSTKDESAENRFHIQNL